MGESRPRPGRLPRRRPPAQRPGRSPEPCGGRGVAGRLPGPPGPRWRGRPRTRCLTTENKNLLKSGSKQQRNQQSLINQQSMQQPENYYARLTTLHPFNGPFSGTTGGAGTRKVKPIWILLKQETASGSGISWAIRQSAPRSEQITTPAPTTQFFTGWMPFLLPNQQRQSTEGTYNNSNNSIIII